MATFSKNIHAKTDTLIPPGDSADLVQDEL